MTIRTSLVVFFLLAVGTAILTTSVKGIYDTRQAAFEGFVQASQTRVDLGEQLIQDYMQDLLFGLQALSTDPLMNKVSTDFDDYVAFPDLNKPHLSISEDIRSVITFLNQFLSQHSKLSNVAFATPSAGYLRSANKDVSEKTRSTYDPTQRFWYKLAVDPSRWDTTFVGEPTLTKATQQPAVLLSKTLIRDNQVAGVLIASMKLESIVDAMNRIDDGTEMKIILTSKQDRIIYNAFDPEMKLTVMAEAGPEYEWLTAQTYTEGTPLQGHLFNQDFYINHNLINGIDWNIYLLTPVEYLPKRTSSTYFVIIASVVLLIIMMLIALWCTKAISLRSIK